MTPIKDSNGRIIGYQKVVGTKTQVFNEHAQMKGWYESTSNKTFDQSGKLVGFGDLSVSLIFG